MANIPSANLKGELLDLKEKTSWSWERMSHEFERIMNERGPSNTTLFRYATGRVKRRNLIVERYVQDAIRLLVVERVEQKLEQVEEQRRSVEKELVDTRVRFRQLAENAKDIIYHYQLVPTRGFEYVSPACLEIIGYTPEEHYADPDLIINIVHPEDREEMERLWRGEGRVGGRHMVRCFHRDGHVVWMESARVPVYNGSGELIALEGIARDVSDRMRAQELLRDSEERFRLAFENGPVGMVIGGLDYKFRKANKAFCEMIGYSEEELKQLTFLDITHPDDVEESERRARELFAGEAARGYSLEKRYVKKNGEEMWGNLSVSLIPDRSGSTHYGMGMLEDITDRKRSETILQSLVEGTSWAVGQDFFRTLVRNLAMALQVKFAFLSQISDQKHVNVKACWVGKEYGEVFEYALEGTPCETVFEHGMAFYPSDVQKLFPAAEWLQEHGIDSYLAVEVHNPAGLPIGHLAVLNDLPMSDKIPRESILKIFAARAGAELERQRVEDQRTRLLSDSIRSLMSGEISRQEGKEEKKEGNS